MDLTSISIRILKLERHRGLQFVPIMVSFLIEMEHVIKDMFQIVGFLYPQLDESWNFLNLQVLYVKSVKTRMFNLLN